jgi:CHAT domain-containing protein
LNSALVLTIPGTPTEGQDNGLLQAWEIFDQIRLDADLVTLSACDTGLGKEMGGEGLIGLTRAFQYAGARSVLASLWNLDDFRAAEFMKQFYVHLQHGQSKDEALQAAQLQMLRSRNSAHPFYWAAFTLNGDWK